MSNQSVNFILFYKRVIAALSGDWESYMVLLIVFHRYGRMFD